MLLLPLKNMILLNYTNLHPQCEEANCQTQIQNPAGNDNPAHFHPNKLQIFCGHCLKE
nr:hypothetical protein Iba_chr05bCG4800 [Ipomoea batatas]